MMVQRGGHDKPESSGCTDSVKCGKKTHDAGRLTDRECDSAATPQSCGKRGIAVVFNDRHVLSLFLLNWITCVPVTALVK